MKESVVYFLRSTDNPMLYKIGYTSNSVTSRMKEIQTSCPFKIEISHSILGDFMAERELHRLLRHERRTGEWFEGEDTHCVAWATLETGSIEPAVFIPWLREELASIQESILVHPGSVSSLEEEGTT